MLPHSVTEKIIVQRDPEICPRPSGELASRVFKEIGGMPHTINRCNRALALVFEDIFDAGKAEGLRLASERIFKVIEGGVA